MIALHKIKNNYIALFIVISMSGLNTYLHFPSEFSPATYLHFPSEFSPAVVRTYVFHLNFHQLCTYIFHLNFHQLTNHHYLYIWMYYNYVLCILLFTYFKVSHQPHLLNILVSTCSFIFYSYCSADYNYTHLRVICIGAGLWRILICLF